MLPDWLVLCPGRSTLSQPTGPASSLESTCRPAPPGVWSPTGSGKVLVMRGGERRQGGCHLPSPDLEGHSLSSSSSLPPHLGRDGVILPSLAPLSLQRPPGHMCSPLLRGLRSQPCPEANSCLGLGGYRLGLGLWLQLQLRARLGHSWVVAQVRRSRQVQITSSSPAL